jgi:phosphoribosylformylglycinamidine synthase
MVNGLAGGEVPKVDAQMAKKTFAALHKAIYTGLVRACHDLSEGGLAVAAAEMAFSGGLGAKISLANVLCLPSPGTDRRLVGRGAGGEGGSRLSTAALLFSESNTRFLCEVQPKNSAAFEAALAEIPHARIGEVTADGNLEIRDDQVLIEANLRTLKEAWKKPLRW